VDSNVVKLERVRQIEAEINHDVMAIVRALTEKCSSGSRYVHFGVTSNDIIDTATALQMHEFYHFLTDDLIRLQESMKSLVIKHRSSVMLGRTHGQHASPITFGLKMAVYLSEVNRHAERVLQARNRVMAGKIMGPVGTGAALGDAALEVQDRVMEILGLSAETASSQIVNRDRYVEFLSVMNGIVTSLEKFATEVRNLQRPEIGEISEYFDAGKQVGSSSMPSKVNPINSENVCSLSRLIRSFIIPEYEGAVTWHERDLTNSAAERFIIPYVCILTDHVLVKMAEILEKLIVYPDRMIKNLLADDFVLSEKIVTELTLAGMPRQDAHEVVREASMRAHSSGGSLLQALREGGYLDRLPESVRHTISDPASFTGSAGRICDRIVQETEGMKKKLMGGVT
ncbi:MAG: adenylosuccinate lyase, partial [Candidatus Thermoplasmatota archaeon]|nr:adenylosuccinate lyase [Candidatus Thermoplasmatota archaeon]